MVVNAVKGWCEEIFSGKLVDRLFSRHPRAERAILRLRLYLLSKIAQI